MQTRYGNRKTCYSCYRPESSCMCSYVTSIETTTKFIILMHPKEYRKIKNGTGRLTHLSLPNSELFVGMDFTHHAKVNAIIASHESYILYPSKQARNLDRHPLHVTHHSKPKAIFLIDSTWACSMKMMRLSHNLHALPHLSFDNTQLSEFKIKRQPQSYCLSTMESTLTLLRLLNHWKIESIDESKLDAFLTPFHQMNTYQIQCVTSPPPNTRQ